MNMKAGLILLAIVACAHGAFGSLQGGLRAKFGIGTDIGTSFFFDLPTTVDDAEAQNWTATDRPDGPLSQLTMYCPDDKVICVMFDDTDYVAGVQIGLSQDQFSNEVFDWDVQGFTNWTTDVNGTTTSFWTKQQYFVSEEYLETSTEDRLAARVANKTLQDGAVWVSGFNGDLYKISTNLTEVLSDTPFTEQSCISWMGLHYYYNMSSSTECASDAILPWFPLFVSGELIAMGFQTFGQITVPDGSRNWFEDPTSAIVEEIVPYGPDCLYNMVDTYGAVTLHVYYVNEPWEITCSS